jgi:hypothetical protein
MGRSIRYWFCTYRCVHFISNTRLRMQIRSCDHVGRKAEVVQGSHGATPFGRAWHMKVQRLCAGCGTSTHGTHKSIYAGGVYGAVHDGAT